MTHQLFTFIAVKPQSDELEEVTITRGEWNTRFAQQLVGGHLELVVSQRFPELALYANEDGHLRGLELNKHASYIAGLPIVGTAAVFRCRALSPSSLVTLEFPLTLEELMRITGKSPTVYMDGEPLYARKCVACDGKGSISISSSETPRRAKISCEFCGGWGDVFRRAHGKPLYKGEARKI